MITIAQDKNQVNPKIKQIKVLTKGLMQGLFPKMSEL